jgi:hypothetical protein
MADSGKKKGGAIAKGHKPDVQTVQAVTTRPVLTASTESKPHWYNETKRQLSKRDTRIGPARSR